MEDLSEFAGVVLREVLGVDEVELSFEDEVSVNLVEFRLEVL